MPQVKETPQITIKKISEALVTFHTPNIPWYQRLWFFIKLPYDIFRYVVTGYMYFGWTTGDKE